MKKNAIKIIQTLLIIIVFIMSNMKIINKPVSIILLIVIIFMDLLFKRRTNRSWVY